eukprot:5802948-Alexandrium_andersonii.AAC.1
MQFQAASSSFKLLPFWRGNRSPSFLGPPPNKRSRWLRQGRCLGFAGYPCGEEAREEVQRC